MRAQLRSELLKQRTTRTLLGLFAAMLGLVTFAELLHGFGLPADNMDTRTEQLTAALPWGVSMGTLFAGLLGAMAFTSEIRHGTIRPSFLVTPRRGRVLAAKVAAAILGGAAFGLVAGAVGVLVGGAALSARGIEIQADPGDFLLLVAGGAFAAALWGTIGVGIGAIVRQQVPVVVGICAWLLFVEQLLVGDLLVADEVRKFVPGALAKAVGGLEPGTLLAPAPAAVVLCLYAASFAVAGWLTTTRRDVV